MRVGIVFGVVSLLVLSGGPVCARQRPRVEAPAAVTIQQTNRKLQQYALSASLDQGGEYPLGAGDQIKIDVFDIPELSEQIRINPGGYISMPLIHQRILAAGRTPSQLETKIAGLLKSRGLVSHPQVTVFVIQRLSQPITIIGAVEHPEVYQAERPTTLLEVLSSAGGLTGSAADYVTVSRMRKDGAPDERRVSLRDLIDRGDPKANILLRGGDVVTVPKAGIVYVVGAVVRPGGFVIQNDSGQMTVLKALALAGGTQRTARNRDALIIRKQGSSGKNLELRVNLKKILSQKAQDVQLRPNDILFVPDSTGKRVLAKAAQAALSVGTGITIYRAGTF